MIKMVRVSAGNYRVVNTMVKALMSSPKKIVNQWEVDAILIRKIT